MGEHPADNIQFLSLEYKDAFEIMMKSTRDSIFFKDLESRFLYISETQLKRLNATDYKEVIGKTDFDFFSLEHATKAFQTEQQIIKTGIPIVDEEEHSKFANGEFSWSKVSRYPLYDRDKNIIGTWGISTEISKQKNAEFQTKEREARFRLLADITIEGIIIHENGLIKDANPAIAAMFGFEPSEVIGRNFLEFIRDDDKSAVIENMATDSNRLLEIHLFRKDGTTFLAEVEGKTMNTFGTKLRMAAIRDITKRRQTEDALRDRELQMRSITDSAYDAILMMDPKGNITYWNPAAERIFGYKNDEAIGKNLQQLISPVRYHEANLAAFSKFVESGIVNAVGETIDLEAIRKDKTIVQAQLSLSAVKMSDGWHSVGILRDITQQKKNEDELKKAKTTAEEATNAKSEFLANMSHEIRTPMNAVIGFSELMKKTDLTTKQRDYINKIDTSAKLLLGIINDILDFSKMEAGKLELEHIDFRLDDVINNIMSMNSNKASEKNIELINNVESNVPNAFVGDPLRLGQILINLVNNAVKFTDKGHVLVETELIKTLGNKCRIKFSVSDTGIGLTNEQKDKLFSAFSQADSSVTRRFGGTGLGLTISKRLVELMNGSIFVESEFGVGSTFSFIVDLAIQAEENKKVVRRKNLTNLSVLIVDDNEVSREILKEQISAFGASVMTVGSGREAIREVKNPTEKKPYDLVIMDWRMPEMDGIEAASTILNDKSIHHMPMAIMVSAYGREEVAKKAESIGIDNFLMKPINQSLLFDTIVNMFDMDKTGMTIQPTVKIDEEAENIQIDGVNILLVEDNPINQEVATEILRSAGAIIELANNGKEAVEAVGLRTYDLVLMDLQMPVMGGYEATKLIRADDKNRELPIIAMTAHAMQGVEAECIAAGMNDYVSKPIDPQNLFKTIRKWAKPKDGAKKTNKIAPPPDASKKEESDLLEHIPGVDTQAGISRVGGNTKLYRKLLFDFASSYSSYPDIIRKAIAENNREEAKRFAHTLKGVAGNISANDVYGFTALLEQELSTDSSGKYEALLKKIDSSLHSINKIVCKVGTATQTVDIPVEKVLFLKDLEPVLQEMARFVWEDNIDAEQTFDQMKRICGSMFAQEIAQIGTSIGAFDFEAAKEPLKKIAGELKIRLDGAGDE